MTKFLTMSLINIRSLNANNLILSDNISDLDTDIIALTETWLTVDTPTLSIIPKKLSTYSYTSY